MVSLAGRWLIINGNGGPGRGTARRQTVDVASRGGVALTGGRRTHAVARGAWAGPETRIRRH